MNLSGPISAHHWFYSPDHGQLCKVIETQTLRCDTTCRVWLPGSDSVVRIPEANLKPLEETATGTPEQITYVAAAARATDALTQDLSACALYADREEDMNNRQKQIGFSQHIRLEWLQYTANLVLAGNDYAAVNNSLQELL